MVKAHEAMLELNRLVRLCLLSPCNEFRKEVRIHARTFCVYVCNISNTFLKQSQGDGLNMSQNQNGKFNLGVLTISDTGARGERAEDGSGNAICEIMASDGYTLVLRDTVADEKPEISAKLRDWSDGGKVDVILTTGGTGLGPRDVTPEATRAVLDIEAPGVGEAMRIETLKFTPFAMLSRATAGVRSGCLIVNLPGSEKAVRETLAVVKPALVHGLEMVKGWRTHALP